MPSSNRPTRCLLGAPAASAGYGEAFAPVNRRSFWFAMNHGAHAGGDAMASKRGLPLKDASADPN